MDNTQETFNDDGHSNAESIQTAKNQQEECNTEYPKWKVCLVIVLAVSVFSYTTGLVYLIPTVLKCLPTSKTAAKIFLTSPTYAKNTVGFGSKLWINRYVEHICPAIVIILCIVCLVVLYSKLAIKTICKEDIKKLDRFFEDLYWKELALQSRWSIDEIAAIKGKILDTVSIIIFESFKSDHVFQLRTSAVKKHIRLVGSMAERTRIRNPDEFDFVFIWPHFDVGNINLEGTIKSLDGINLWYNGKFVQHLRHRKILIGNKNINGSYLISPSGLFYDFIRNICIGVSALPDCKMSFNGPVATLKFGLEVNSLHTLLISVDLLPVISLPKSKATHIFLHSPYKKILDKSEQTIFLSHIPTGRVLTNISGGGVILNATFTENDTFSITLPHDENKLIKNLEETQRKLFVSYQILKDMKRPLRMIVFGDDENEPYRLYLSSYHLKCLTIEMAYKGNQQYSTMSLSAIVIALWEHILLSYSKATKKGKVTFWTLLFRKEDNYKLKYESVKLSLKSILTSNRDVLLSFFEKIVHDKTYDFEAHLEQYNDLVRGSGDGIVTEIRTRFFWR